MVCRRFLRHCGTSGGRWRECNDGCLTLWTHSACPTLSYDLLIDGPARTKLFCSVAWYWHVSLWYWSGSISSDTTCCLYASMLRHSLTHSFLCNVSIFTFFYSPPTLFTLEQCVSHPLCCWVNQNVLSSRFFTLSTFLHSSFLPTFILIHSNVPYKFRPSPWTLSSGRIWGRGGEIIYPCSHTSPLLYNRVYNSIYYSSALIQPSSAPPLFVFHLSLVKLRRRNQYLNEEITTHSCSTMYIMLYLIF